MKRLSKAIWLAAGLAMLVQFAASTDKKPEWKGKIVKEADVTVVQNPKEPLYKDSPLVLKEDWSVGGANADAASIISGARTLAVDDAENVYVLDRQESLVKMFDRNGKYITTFGRKGQGPGELQYPRAICIHPITKEIVIDGPGTHISYFSPDGKFLRSVSFANMNLRMCLDSRGNYYILDYSMEPGNSFYFTKKFGPDLKFVAQIAKSPTPKPDAPFNPFMAINYWQIDKDDNLVYGYPVDYEIRFYSPTNKIIKKIRRNYVPVEVTDAERKEEAKGAPPQMKFDFSKYHSAFARFILSNQGHLLVQSWEKRGESYFFDLFDAEGQYLAKILLRPDPILWRNGKLYSVEDDDEGYKVIKKYTVTWLKN